MMTIMIKKNIWYLMISLSNLLLFYLYIMSKNTLIMSVLIGFEYIAK